MLIFFMFKTHFMMPSCPQTGLWQSWRRMLEKICIHVSKSSTLTVRLLCSKDQTEATSHWKSMTTCWKFSKRNWNDSHDMRGKILLTRLHKLNHLAAVPKSLWGWNQARSRMSVMQSNRVKQRGSSPEGNREYGTGKIVTLKGKMDTEDINKPK